MLAVAIGGCVYRSMVHVGHAASVGQFCCQFGGQVGFEYRHTSNLPQGRSLLLRQLIQYGMYDALISVDSDTEFRARDLIDELPLAIALDVAIGIAPVICGNPPRLNIFHALGEPFAPSACGGGRPDLWAGGFGLAVFNLGWFREHWLDPQPELIDGIPPMAQGEDTQMCRSVIARGGRVIPLWVATAHYDTSNSNLQAGRISYRAGRML